MKTHHNTPCFLNAARTCLAYVCSLALFCPCAFLGCDLLACMGHLIFSFLCKHTSAALRHLCLCARMRVWVGAFVCVCKIQLQDQTRSMRTQGRPPLASPVSHAGARQLRRGNGHEQRSTHPHGLSSITRRIEIRFASPPYTCPPHTPP